MPKADKKTVIYMVLLALIVVSAFWLRALPARFGELQAIDPFYLFRISEYVLENSWQMPEIDLMRHHPFGAKPGLYDPPTLYYLPAILYVVMGGLSMTYLQFAILFPAMMGALAVAITYFVGKLLYDRKAGLLAAFFMATVPAFITRTSAGFFEKESMSAPFFMLGIYFFLKGYKDKSWKSSAISGIVSGLALLFVAQTWGGARIFFMLIAGFALILLLLNQHSKKLTATFMPMFITIIVGYFVFPYKYTSLTEMSYLLLIATAIIMGLRHGVERYGLVKKEHLPYFVPAMALIGAVGFFISTMFSDVAYSTLQGIIIMVSMEKATAASTVAEQIGGSWADIYSATGTGYISSIIPQLGFMSQYVSLYIFMFASVAIMAYIFYTKKYDWSMVFVILWVISSIALVFGMIRLLFVLGPAAAVSGAIAISWLIDKARQVTRKEAVSRIRHMRNAVLVLGAVYMSLLLITNFGSAYVYSNSIGPSFNDYWKESMEFLATETPENSNILSWWDFGYWFQTRGQRPSVSDGGGAGPRYDIAVWFMNDARNWSDDTCEFEVENYTCESWLKERYHVDYILMDYTLPGKYGAISKIGSKGSEITGMLQFQQTGTYPQGNKTIYEFKAGQYSIWLPFEGAGLSGTPMFLISEGDQYVSRAYVNDVCTTSGIITLGTETPNIGGCVAITNFGVFYVPEEAYRNVFSSLMFMDGFGLPVEKTFDNGAVKIYQVLYGDEPAKQPEEGTDDISSFMSISGEQPL